MSEILNLTPTTKVYQLKDEYGLYDILLGDLHDEVQQQILENQKLRRLVEEKLAWLSTWKGCWNELGKQHKMFQELLEESKK